MDVEKVRKKFNISKFVVFVLKKVSLKSYPVIKVKYSKLNLGTNLLSCRKCQIKVHLRCSGEKNAIAEKDFECDRCKNDQNEACIVCHQFEGFMRKVGDKYVHIICALFNTNFDIIDFQLMTIVQKKDIKAGNKTKTCTFCNSNKGCLLNCLKCKDMSAHLYCALRYRASMILKDPDNLDFWQIEFEFKKDSQLKVLCENDREEPLYCICKKDSDDNMVSCDNCEMWYHFKCVGLPNKDIKNNWFCPFCTEFINNKANFLLNELTNDEDLKQQAKERDWKHLTIHKHLKYRILDLIFVVILYTRKANILLSNLSSLENVKKHIELGYSIPINLQHFISQLEKKVKNYQKNENKKLSQEIKELHENINNTTLPLSNKLELLKTSYDKLVTIYSNYLDTTYGIIDEKYSILDTTIKQVKWGIDAISILLSNKPLNTELKALSARYLDTFPKKDLFVKEVSTINEYLQDFVNWQKKTKEMLAEHVKKKTLLEKEKEKNTNTYNKQANLTKRKENLIANLNTKIPSEQMQGIIDEGNLLKVNLSKEIQSIEECLKEACDWNDSYIKEKNNLDINKLSSLLDKTDNYLVSTQFMYEAVENLFEAEFWQLRVDSFINNFNSINSGEYYDINEINYLIQNYQHLLLKDEKRYKQLNDINNNLEKTKNNILNYLNSENNVSALKQLLKDLDSNTYKIERGKIEQKITLLESLDKLIKGKSDTWESLVQIEQLMNEYNIKNEEYSNTINQKKKNIVAIKSEIENKLSVFTREEIEAVLRKIKDYKISLPDEETMLKAYLECFDWLDEFISSLANNVSIDAMIDLSQENLIRYIGGYIRITDKSFLFKQNTPEIFKSTYIDLRIAMCVKRSRQIVQQLLEGNQNSVINENELFDLKQEIEILGDLKGYEGIISELDGVLAKVNVWIENYNKLLSMSEEGITNLDQCKAMLDELNLDRKLIVNLNQDDRMKHIEQVEKLLNTSINLKNLIEKNKEADINERDSIENLKAILSELEKEPSNRKLSYAQQFKTEIIKYEKWIEKYNNYIHMKRNNQTDKIDICLLEVLLEESKKIIANISNEVKNMELDVVANKSWSDKATKLLSENENNVNPEELQWLYDNINNITIPDKDLVSRVKQIEYLKRVSNFFAAGNLNYKLALQTVNEVATLRNANDIKKKQNFVDLQNQVQKAKNFKEMADNLKKGKQINEDLFNNNYKELFSEKSIIDLSEEKTIFDNYNNIKNEFTKKYEALRDNKQSIQDYEKLILDIKKFPVKLSGLIHDLEQSINEAKVLQRDIKRLLDSTKINKVTLTRERVIGLYEKFKDSPVNFHEGDQLVKMYDTSIESFNNLKRMLDENDADIIELMGYADAIEVHNLSEEKIIRRSLWFKKYDYFISSPTYRILKNLKLEADELDLNENNPQYENIKETINKTEVLISEILNVDTEEQIREIQAKADIINTDISEYIVEQQTRLAFEIKPEKPSTSKESLLGNKRKPTDDILHSLNVIKMQRLEQERKLGHDKEEELRNNVSIAQGRSKRNINIKIDKDYYYDKEFIEGFENKIVNKASANLPSEVDNATKDFDNDDKVNNMVAAIQNKPKFDKEEMRRNNLSTLSDILGENPIFQKKGEEYITKSSAEIEEDIAKSYPTLGHDYKQTFANMCKTLKELEKYKKVSTLITKGKLNFLKVSKYPYGQKYIDKLKKIETGSGPSQEAKVVSKEGVQSNKSSTNDVVLKTSNSFLNTVFQDMNDLYSSLEPEKKKPTPKPISQSISKILESNFIEEDEDDDGSLKSLSDNQAKFSPTGKDNQDEHALIRNLTNESFTKKDSFNTIDFEKKPSVISITNNYSKNNRVYDLYAVAEEDTKLNHRKKYTHIPLFYDPFKFKPTVATKSTSEVTTPSKAEDDNALIQIWKGVFKLSKYDLRVSFVSMKSINEFMKLPKLPEVLNISSKAKTKEVIHYLEKNFGNSSRLILTGWLEIGEEFQLDSYAKLAEDYDKNDKTGYIVHHDVKFYFFPLSQRYSKFYKKFSNEIVFHNKDIMQKLGDKIILFVAIAKLPLPEFNAEKMNPVVLDQLEENLSIITDEDDKNSTVDIEDILGTGDLKMIEQYVNTNFSNLSQEEMLMKLLSLNENTRFKLLEVINQIKMRKTEEPDVIMTDTNKNIEQAQEDIEEDIIHEPLLESNYFNNLDYNTNEPQVNEHLSYLGFSSVSTDLLKGEILKNQQSGVKQNSNELIITEEMRRRAMNQGGDKEYNPNNPFISGFAQNSYRQAMGQMPFVLPNCKL
jgi:cellobiose-specific phosphotransferase system component IIA